jgi:hypothetical protein
MYLTAHRVESPTTGHSGINAFHYAHGRIDWEVPPLEMPDQAPGTLVTQRLTVEPPGNRVRGYLDIVAPDDATWHEIDRGFHSFTSAARRGAFPWEGVVGRCLFRIGFDAGLARTWRRELAELYGALRSLRDTGSADTSQ